MMTKIAATTPTPTPPPAAAAPTAAETPPAATEVPIEPTSERPVNNPYVQGTWGKIGVGTGAVLGAGLLGALGGGIGSNIASSMGRGGGTAVLGGLALLGVGLGGYFGGKLAHYIAESNHEGSENNRIEATFGTSTLEHARRLIAEYDHDHNGEIDRDNKSGFSTMNENGYIDTRRRSESHQEYDYWDDDWNTVTTSWTEKREVSAHQIWAKADANSDDIVEAEELARYMSHFDSDASGALTTGEHAAFDNANPVIYGDWNRS